MLTKEKFYGQYTIGCSRRKKWENEHLPVIDTSYKTLEKARSRTIRELSSAVNTLANYGDTYYREPLKAVSREGFDSLYDGLVKKHDFTMLEMDEYVSTIMFESRAVISEKNHQTNTNLTVDLGLFKTRLYFDDYVSSSPRSVGLSAVSTPSGENNPRNIGGKSCFHPHIGPNGGLCLGGYLNPRLSGADTQKFDIMSILYNVCGLLCRYNANSLNWSGAYIDNWVGQKCSVCYQFDGEQISCEKTKVIIHKDCSEEIDGKFYSLNCIKKCSVCEKTTPYYFTINNKAICEVCQEKEEIKV